MIYVTANKIRSVMTILLDNDNATAEEVNLMDASLTLFQHGFTSWDETKQTILELVDKGEYFISEIERYCTEKESVGILDAEQLELFNNS